jgi:hypothetical protein
MRMQTDTKPGPVLDEAIDEVQGIFPSETALQTAITGLELAVFDRARISLPAANPAHAEATPAMGAEEPMTEQDTRQARTLGSSMAAGIGAIAGAGLTVATGGAAGLALAAAAGLGAVAGGSVLAATSAANQSLVKGHDDAADAGQLVLAVSISTAPETDKAVAAMRDAGASRVEPVRRVGPHLV